MGWRKFDASIVWYRRRPEITCASPMENSFIPIKVRFYDIFSPKMEAFSKLQTLETLGTSRLSFLFQEGGVYELCCGDLQF
ncbi:hypothetical protein AKJ66_02880 [candidate division MSBL1 archaeon SCGC-AAA259E22]|uniref:Uncharacterized protein n=1 Tax=candidate division MSBL1 archaeon SCGC-AAA259E22 TaxID=1698265 RepID=A0A133UG37_9EURY|nr:hypothetical protein AKJ66_02880 [candidate division MSBL1 archaeon SCGC-AAA259E22]